jgi:hypothetical protein
MVHLWQALAQVAPQAQAAIDRIGAFVVEKTGGTTLGDPHELPVDQGDGKAGPDGSRTGLHGILYLVDDWMREELYSAAPDRSRILQW